MNSRPGPDHQRKAVSLVSGGLLLGAAVVIACLHHGAQSADAVAASGAMDPAGGQGHVAPLVYSKDELTSSTERRPSALANSPVGRSFSSSSSKATLSSDRVRSFTAAPSSGDEDEHDGASLTRTKVRDRSLDLSTTRSSGQKREHGDQASAASSGRAQGSFATAAGSGGAPGVSAHPSQRAAEPVAAADSTPENVVSSAEPVKPAELPVVYRLSDEQLLEHSPGIQPEVLEPIRDQFDRDAGVGELDPADPEYTRRWNIAGPSADERYRTLFGWAAYNDASRRAAAVGTGAAPAQGK